MSSPIDILLSKLLLIVLFNVCFVVPLLAMLAALTVAGDRAEASS